MGKTPKTHLQDDLRAIAEKDLRAVLFSPDGHNWSVGVVERDTTSRLHLPGARGARILSVILPETDHYRFGQPDLNGYHDYYYAHNGMMPATRYSLRTPPMHVIDLENVPAPILTAWRAVHTVNADQYGVYPPLGASAATAFRNAADRWYLDLSWYPRGANQFLIGQREPTRITYDINGGFRGVEPVAQQAQRTV